MSGFPRRRSPEPSKASIEAYIQEMFKVILAMRRWDEAAKVKGKKVPELDAWQKSIAGLQRCGHSCPLLSTLSHEKYDKPSVGFRGARIDAVVARERVAS